MNNNIANTLTCPITSSQFIDPVIASDGRTYERSAIEEWLKISNLSPITKELITELLVTNKNISSDKFINECNTIINKIYVDDIILSIKNELENINKFLQKSMSLEIIDNKSQQKLINQYNCILIEMTNYLLMNKTN